MYFMSPDPISLSYFTNPSHYSVSVYVSLLSLSGNGSVNTFPRQQIHATIELLDARVCWSLPVSFLGNNSVKTLPSQRRIVRSVVFSTVRVVSKEIRRLVLPRTSCIINFAQFLYGSDLKQSHCGFY
jgi:hypothetical protein